MTQGGADPELKDDAEYPAWLWNLLEQKPTVKQLRKKMELSGLKEVRGVLARSLAFIPKAFGQDLVCESWVLTSALFPASRVRVRARPAHTPREQESGKKWSQEEFMEAVLTGHFTFEDAKRLYKLNKREAIKRGNAARKK